MYEAAETLSERLEAPVQVTMGKRRGRIVITFASAEDLDRLLDLLTDPGADDSSTATTATRSIAPGSGIVVIDPEGPVE